MLLECYDIVFWDFDRLILDVDIVFWDFW